MHNQPTDKVASINTSHISHDDIVELITEFSNISMGMAWYNNMDVFTARHYTSYVLSVAMAFLDVPVQFHNNVSRHAIDGTVNIYYFSNGELRSQPTIYADKQFRNLTKR